MKVTSKSVDARAGEAGREVLLRYALDGHPEQGALEVELLAALELREACRALVPRPREVLDLVDGVDWPSVVEDAALKWNLALDADHGPRNGGCQDCRGVVTVTGGRVERNEEYYALAHASKFVRPRARRVGSAGGPAGTSHVAFRNPDGSVALVALNRGRSAQRAAVRLGGRTTNLRLPARSVATAVWRAPDAPESEVWVTSGDRKLLLARSVGRASRRTRATPCRTRRRTGPPTSTAPPGGRCRRHAGALASARWAGTRCATPSPPS